MPRPLPTEPLGHSKQIINFLLFAIYVLGNAVVFAALCYYVVAQGILDSAMPPATSGWNDACWALIALALFGYLVTLAIDPGGMPLHNDHALFSLISHFLFIPVVGYFSGVPISESLLYLCATELVCFGIIFPRTMDRGIKSYYAVEKQLRNALAEEVVALKAEGKSWHPDTNELSPEHKQIATELEEEDQISLFAMPQAYQVRALNAQPEMREVYLNNWQREPASVFGAGVMIGAAPILGGIGLFALLINNALANDYQSAWYVLFAGVAARLASGFRTMKAGLEKQMIRSSETDHPWIIARWTKGKILLVLYAVIAVGGGLYPVVQMYLK